MPTLADRGSCTGCGACKAACPKAAIVMEADTEGFPAPRILSEKCVNCGLCEKSCPALHAPDWQPIREAYAAQLRDRDALKESTSGGLFTVFAREIFRRGGAVYGCVWDQDYNAVVRKADNEEDIGPMRGSKYVWSWAGDAFPEIREMLESGRTVLFTGLPCQAAGLKKYLKKDYDNLYLMDFLCSGTPSPMVFHKWLDTLCAPEERASLDLKFRDKDPYGVGVHITYRGQKKKNAPRGEHITNPYYYSFYSHLIDRRSCYRCPYGTDQRISDLTVCDYWGIENYHKDMDIRAGVSGLLVNSEKGADLLERVKGALELRETSKENIGRANNLLCNGKQRKRSIPANRDGFFSAVANYGWKAGERKYLHDAARLKRLVMLKLPAKAVRTLKRIKSQIRG